MQALAPEYAKAAGILAEKGSSIALAKVHRLNSFLISDVRVCTFSWMLQRSQKQRSSLRFGAIPPSNSSGTGRTPSTTAVRCLYSLDQVLIPFLTGRTADTIVSWLEKKTGPAAKTLATVDEAKAFVADNDIAVVGFFDSVDSDGSIYGG